MTGDNDIKALKIDKAANRPDGKNIGDYKCHGNWVEDFSCVAERNTACKFGYEWTGTRWA